MRRVFALTGKPGCGKSFVARTFRKYYGYPIVEMGGEMKKLYQDYPLADDRKADKLPDSTWDMAQHMRDTHGPEGPAVASTSRLAAAFGENNRVVLDGVRNTAEVQYIKELFDCSIHLIDVSVDYNTRRERFIERSDALDEYDDKYVARAVAERKMNTRTDREIAEGLQDAIDYANYKIDNSGSKKETELQVARLLDDFDRL
jgi:dephospho-CoA kinase